MGLQKVRVTDDTVELSPGSAPRMAIRTNIALPDPAKIGARFRRTVLGKGVDRPRTPALGSDQRRQRRRWPVDMLWALLTGLTVGLMGQAGKRFVGFRRAFGLLSRWVLRRQASLRP